MEVIDQSHNNSYTADNGGTLYIHYGSAINSSTPGTSNKSKSRPLRRCPAPSSKYTRRERIEFHMTSYFFENGWGRKCYVLHGVRGSGKTQLALSFVHRYFYSLRLKQRRFSLVCWIDASSVHSIIQSLEAFAQAVGAGSAIEDALDWLAQCDDDDNNWILLFDNANDPTVDLSTYFPDCSHGNILITTHNYHAKRYGLGPGSDFAVSEMSEIEAVELLIKHARIEDPSPLVMPDFVALVQVLDRFPLSIAQVGAYIATTPCAPRECIEIATTDKESFLANLDHLPSSDGYKYSSLRSAWLASYNELSPPSKQLLHLFAYMHHEYIKQEIFQNACSGLGAYEDRYGPLFNAEERKATITLKELCTHMMRDGHWDVSGFRKLVKQLQSHSFISFTPAQAACLIHPKIQEWLRSAVPNGQPPFRERTIILLASTTSLTKRKTAKEAAFLQSLVPHVDQALAGFVLSFEGCRNEIGFVYESVGRWEEVIRCREAYKDACVKMLGQDHFNTLTSLQDLARAYDRQARFDEAEILLTQVIGASKEESEVHCLDALQSKQDLAENYLSQGRFEEAEPLQLEVLASRKAQLGTKHLDTISSTHNLALIFWGQGRFDEAEILQLGVMEDRTGYLGADHLDTLTSVASLAATYHSQGRVKEAELLQLEVVEARTNQLGPNHLDTLSSIDELALTYCTLGRLEGAERLQLQVVESRKLRLGADHLHTFTSMNNLAMTYNNQGRLEEAEQLQIKVVEGRKRKLGHDHLFTLAATHNLASIYYKQGRFSEAEQLLSPVVEERKKRLGATHSSTLSSISLLAMASRSRGRIRRAVELDLQVIKSQRKRGDTTDEVLNRAEALIESNLSAYEKHLRTKHRDVKDAIKLFGKLGRKL